MSTERRRAAQAAAWIAGDVDDQDKADLDRAPRRHVAARPRLSWPTGSPGG